MKPDRWEEVVRVFEAALELSDLERGPYLDEACASDAELRARVEEMIAADRRTDGILGSDPAGLAGHWSEGPVPAATLRGRTVGPYRIQDELGRGGMGVVYLARREDVDLLVALKVVAGGLASPERLRRFHSERRLLARLEHPAIARLLDAGVMDDGTPWFAMERVQGVPLDRYCRERDLDVAGRLDLFDQVCAAVEYAHRRLIVHRDLKPANILVTAAGAPKLLDFGIAKILGDDDATDERGAGGSTRADVRMMTPEFAAPEQVRGDPVTTATDVYALGVILYELLAGVRPRSLRGLGAAEIERIVLGPDPAPPSSAGRMARLSAGARRDLDAIVLRALQGDPDRRYASAEQLRADLAAFRDGRTVSARPATRRYRLARFVRRNRGTVAAAAAGMLLVGGFAAAMAVQRAATARERDRARLEAVKAERISAFLAGLFEASDPYDGPGMDTRAGELLARGRARLTDLEDEPSLLADVEHTLAGVYLSLGEYDEAEELYARSLAARRGAGLSEPTDLVASLQGLARVLSFTGSLDSAAVLLGEALEAGGDRTGDAGGPEIELQRAEVMMDLGTLQFRRADFPAAEALYREALELYEGGLDYPDRRIAQAQGNLGLALSAERRLGESERYNRAAVATFEALPGDQSAYLAQAYNNLAVTLERQGRLAEAEGLQRRALEAKRASLPVGHSSIGVTMTNLAVVLARQGELDEAEALLLEALELQRTAVGPEHRYVINALTGLAEVDMARGDPRGALTRLTEARSLVLKAVPADHPRVATLLLRMGAALRAAGDPAGAEPLLREATGIRERALGPDAPQSVTAKVALAGALIDLSRFDEAATLLEAVNAGSAPSDDGDGSDASGGAATAADELERLRSARGG